MTTPSVCRNRVCVLHRSFEDRPLAFRKKEGRMVLPNGVLILMRIRRPHIGKYTCTANGQHVVKQTSAWVYVENESRCLPSESKGLFHALSMHYSTLLFNNRTCMIVTGLFYVMTASSLNMDWKSTAYVKPLSAILLSPNRR